MSNFTGGPAPVVPAQAGGTGTGQLADFGQRAIAAIIDGVIFAVIVGVLSSIPIIGWPFRVFGWVLFFAYHFYCWTNDNPIGLRGQTLGKKVMNIKVVMDDGSDLTPQQAAIRCVGYICDLGIGVLLALRPDRKALHDLIAHTKVIKV